MIAKTPEDQKRAILCREIEMDKQNRWFAKKYFKDQSDISDNTGLLTVTEARERTREDIKLAYLYNGGVLISALPALGKTTSAIKSCKETGLPVSYFAPRRDLYTQATEIAENVIDVSGLTISLS